MTTKHLAERSDELVQFISLRWTLPDRVPHVIRGVSLAFTMPLRPIVSPDFLAGSCNYFAIILQVSTTSP